ncbi:hypothetical protein MVEN_01516400 [Mycena venus]|uniref:ZZ-type domain-containing protein n=1 Tax=Mycena venus TaxID=2733690 RepID=A0A8H6XT34_9AGAR|nr:hypothetical protein MVEN_01516400 [Mycena venus]
MGFSIKATYGRSGELRKLSFPSGFPTYDELYNQLYRVFPISHNYYLSKLLFSPDSSKSSILIGREVHNAEQYNSCIAPYANGLFSNAMLRFTVFDETPHKLPAGFVADNTSPAPLTGGIAPNPFISMSAIPPPPIILSSTPGPSASMDVDSSSERYSPSTTSTLMPQQHQSEPQSVTAGKASSCCGVSEGKVEIEGIVSKFKEDLDRILKSSFATPAPTPLPPAAPAFVPMPPPPPSSFCLFKYCTTCAKIFQGPWFACEKCSIVVCPNCQENLGSGFCVAAMAPHIMKKEVCAACPAEAQPPRPTSLAAWQPPMSWPTPPQQQGYSPIYPFGGLQPSISPFIPTLPRVPAVAAAAVPLPPLPVPSVAQVPEAPAPPAPPVIHRGVVCDMCENVVEGIRHKCLDCPNYDLSLVVSLYTQSTRGMAKEMRSQAPARALLLPPPVPQVEEQPAVHYATCNLCDSRIRGDRYKCADCPDFDTCSNCFSITREQHPRHAFVKLSKATDYIRRENPHPPMHFVTCDGCSKTIYGIRYKCMHPECPDFDLCEGCEAFPIPMHPDNHPLLKMKSPSTVVPTVYRVGQTTLIDHEDAQRGRSPVPVPRARSRSPSFGRGFMMNPNDRRNTMPASFFDSAPSPIQPPSPFFFRSESSRSSSPVMAYQAPPRPISPYVPRPSPMMMPGGLYDEPAFARQPQPSYTAYSYGRPQPTASRFSHSPSPSPPLFRDNSRSRSPPRRPRHETWGTPAMYSDSDFGFDSMRQQAEQAEQQLHAREMEQLEREAREFEQREEEQRKAREFWIEQDLAQADRMARERREAIDQLAEAQARLELRVEEQQIRWSAAAVPPIPVAAVAEPSFPSFWPKSSEELRHLMQHDTEPAIDAFSRLSVQEEPAAVMDSPLTGEALLNRPVETPTNSAAFLLSQAHHELVKREENAIAQVRSSVSSFNHSLAALLNGYESENEVEKKDEEPLVSIAKDEPSPVPIIAPAAPSLAPAAVPVPIPVPAPVLGLCATFVNDVTLPDGQIFPPGAEFMKCWQMVNSGGVDWPAGTELVYVAGERLAREVGGPANVPIGSVKVGAEIDLWTGELKAPETPGRYVSYWRLRDGQGKLFGESIWIDINVTETRSNESSLSSSSIIVMPRGAQSVPTSSASGGQDASNVSRGEVEEDELSEHGSDVSSGSGSLISVPTSDDEEWASVPAEEPPQAQRYVVLYDDASSQSSSDNE